MITRIIYPMGGKRKYWKGWGRKPLACAGCMAGWFSIPISLIAGLHIETIGVVCACIVIGSVMDGVIRRLL